LPVENILKILNNLLSPLNPKCFVFQVKVPFQVSFPIKGKDLIVDIGKKVNVLLKQST